MSAKDMFKSLNQKAPSALKEKHHGNKRRAVARMKVQARQDERRENEREAAKLIKDEEL